MGFESPAKPGMRGLCSFSRMVTKTGALNGWFLVGGRVFGVCGNCSMVLVGRNNNPELV